ncbi:hypothetical protein N7456_000996 [Penicillium angulare]|uniref:Uncharacterized protein n=1 Tax=Penicillium angulare TaxID=116970 RepID=A0A9W9GEK8_9EURO|nr:hypothetical protein N7456_000996 [Penicillium angulare]
MRGKYVQGAIIKTSLPHPREWMIDRVINEYNEQRSSESCVPEDDLLSFATIRMRCFRRDQPSITADMRIYLQVPFLGTEHQSAQSRGRQKTNFNPRELIAYHKMTRDEEVSQFTPNLLGYEKGQQSEHGLVPKGFEIAVVWQRVPGVCLGLPSTVQASPFWDLPLSKRDRVREHFEGQVIKMCRLGAMQAVPTLCSLVFDEENDRLYWVGFYDADLKKTDGEWHNSWYGIFQLAKPPRGDNTWTKWDWSGDLHGWTF